MPVPLCPGAEPRFRWTGIAHREWEQLAVDAALVIAVAYVIQVQSAAWYVRFTDTVFGMPATAVLARPDLAPPAPPEKPLMNGRS